jgi:hypothetical protein
MFVKFISVSFSMKQLIDFARKTGSAAQPVFSKNPPETAPEYCLQDRTKQ